jgi:hypothetical protein
VNRLIAVTKCSRNEARDRCLLLLMFRHDLRASEAWVLTWSKVDLESRVLHVQRLKKGLFTTHPAQRRDQHHQGVAERAGKNGGPDGGLFQGIDLELILQQWQVSKLEDLDDHQVNQVQEWLKGQ